SFSVSQSLGTLSPERLQHLSSSPDPWARADGHVHRNELSRHPDKRAILALDYICRARPRGVFFPRWTPERIARKLSPGFQSRSLDLYTSRLANRAVFHDRLRCRREMRGRSEPGIPRKEFFDGRDLGDRSRIRF